MSIFKYVLAAQNCAFFSGSGKTYKTATQQPKREPNFGSMFIFISQQTIKTNLCFSFSADFSVKKHLTVYKKAQIDRVFSLEFQAHTATLSTLTQHILLKKGGVQSKCLPRLFCIVAFSQEKEKNQYTKFYFPPSS